MVLMLARANTVFDLPKIVVIGNQSGKNPIVCMSPRIESTI